MNQSFWTLLIALSSSLTLSAAELRLEPIDTPVDDFPPSFTASTGGSGPEGDWKVLTDALPSAMKRISPLAPNTNRKKVIGQFSTLQQRNRFPMLTYQPESFDDFTLTTRIKTTADSPNQNAGLVFRWQNPENYYSVRLDTKGGWFLFRKVVNGQAQEPLGNRTQVPAGEWHQLSVECQGPRITLSLNDSETIPVLTDTQFTTGKIGYWTESGTIAFFGDTRINYQPKIATAQRIVDPVLKKFNKVIDLKLFARSTEDGPASLIAGSDPTVVGEPADDAAIDTIDDGRIYYAKKKKSVIVTMPVKDRNGESMAAVRVELKSFKGQTQQNALARTIPIVKMIQARALDRADLFD